MLGKIRSLMLLPVMAVAFLLVGAPNASAETMMRRYCSWFL